MATKSYEQVQHDNYKVVIVKDCDAIPFLRRTSGPRRGDYYGRWSRRYTRRQAARVVVFHSYALQNKVTRALRIEKGGSAKALQRGAETF